VIKKVKRFTTIPLTCSCGTSYENKVKFNKYRIHLIEYSAANVIHLRISFLVEHIETYYYKAIFYTQDNQKH